MCIKCLDPSDRGMMLLCLASLSAWTPPSSMPRHAPRRGRALVRLDAATTKDEVRPNRR